MELYPKFIIESIPDEGDCLIIGKSTYHKELANDKSKVKGGGWWILDKKTSTITFHGTSYDFGAAKEDDIKSCIQRKMVFSNKYLTVNLSEVFKFKIINQTGEVVDLQ